MSFEYEAYKSLKKKFKKLKRYTMSRFTDVNDALTRMDAATTDLAGDVEKLRNEIKDGMSPAEAEAVRVKASALVTRLEALAKDPEEPIPTVPGNDGGDTVVGGDGSEGTDTLPPG